MSVTITFAKADRRPVQQPGLRGGKFYYDKGGHLQYGTQPSGERSSARPPEPHAGHMLDLYHRGAVERGRKREMERHLEETRKKDAEYAKRKGAKPAAPGRRGPHKVASTAVRVSRETAQKAVASFKAGYQKFRHRVIQLVQKSGKVAGDAKIAAFHAALRVGHTWQRFEHHLHKGKIDPEHIVMHALMEVPGLIDMLGHAAATGVAHALPMMMSETEDENTGRFVIDEFGRILLKAEQLGLFGQRKEVEQPGSRGGKYYINRQGNIVYGQPPAHQSKEHAAVQRRIDALSAEVHPRPPDAGEEKLRHLEDDLMDRSEFGDEVPPVGAVLGARKHRHGPFHNLLGRTKSGKQVWNHTRAASSKFMRQQYKDFTVQDHLDATELHHQAAVKAKFKGDAEGQAHHWRLHAEHGDMMVEKGRAEARLRSPRSEPGVRYYSKKDFEAEGGEQEGRIPIHTGSEHRTAIGAKLIDGLTVQQAQLLLNKHVVGDFPAGANRYASITKLTDAGYMTQVEGRLIVTDRGKKWCDRNHMNVPVPQGTALHSWDTAPRKVIEG
jgi:hypothetical protein